MNTKIISAIAFKLFAIYIVVSMILVIPAAIGSFLAMKSWTPNFSNSIFWPALIITLTAIVTFIIFKGLWRLGNSTVNQITEINTTDNNFDIKEFEKSLFILLGLYFSISAFVTIPNIASSLWVSSQSSNGISIQDYAWIFSITVQILIGLSLIKRPNQWLGIIRNLGLSKKTL